MSRIALAACTLALAALAGLAGPALAQGVSMGNSVNNIDMAIGRSIPMTTDAAIQRVSVANPEVADVILIADRELVVNAMSSGLTDLIIWQTDGQKSHFRISVHSPTDRKQVVLQVRFAEVSTDFLREIGFSFLWGDQKTRVGTGAFAVPRADDGDGPRVPDVDQFATILSVDELDNFTALLDMAQQDGKIRILAEPNLIAANGEEATFLAGGELPVPVAQPTSVGGVTAVTIQYQEFGVRLSFRPEILSEDLVKLRIEPEVSAVDFANAVVTSGFEIPAFRTRKASTTVDLKTGQTLAIAGLLNTEVQKLSTGVPLLKDIPVLGLLFSSERFQRNETELIILVQPMILDPLQPRQPPPLPGEEDDGSGDDVQGEGS